MSSGRTRIPDILLIDDNVELAELLAAALRNAGYTVWQADNAKTGMQLLREHDIGVLITDVVMPEQDGFETVQQARKERPNLRIIVISGDAPRNTPLYLEIGQKLGAHRALMKPFPLATLIETVSELLQDASDRHD